MLLGIHQNNESPDDTTKNVSEAVIKYKKAFDTQLVQVFISNNRLHLLQSKLQKNFDEIIKGFKLSKNTKLTHFVVHVGYITKIDSPNEGVRFKSFEDIRNLYVVLNNVKRVLKQRVECYINIHMPNEIADDIIQLFTDIPSSVKVLFETPNNQPLETFCKLFNELLNEKITNIFITIDTAHVFSSGTTIQQLMSEKDNPIKPLEKYIKLIHFNGNEHKFNSRTDKHCSLLNNELDEVFRQVGQQQLPQQLPQQQQPLKRKDLIEQFIKYVKQHYKHCLGFILERNELTTDEEEFEYLRKLIV